MARKATIQLKVHRQVIQSIPLDEVDIECLIEGVRLVTPFSQRIDRLSSVFKAAEEEQIAAFRPVMGLLASCIIRGNESTQEASA